MVFYKYQWLGLQSSVLWAFFSLCSVYMSVYACANKIYIKNEYFLKFTILTDAWKGKT